MLPGRGAAVATTVVLHLLLWWGWLVAQQRAATPTGDPAPSMQWVELRPLAPYTAAPRRPVQAPRPAGQKLPPARAQPASPMAAPPVTVQEQPAAPAPQTAGERFLDQARRDIAAIERDLRNQARGLVKAPADSPQIRMQKGIAHAAEMAQNKWYEAPKVQELVVAGAYGGRRYRVITAGGTYCVTYETNHALDGRDSMKDGIQPKFTNCPPNEQPATKQD